MPSVQRFTHTKTLLLSTPGSTTVAMLTYDPVLSRVRIDQSVAAFAPVGTPLNNNPFFETDTSGWSGSSAALARSTSQAHQGVASCQMTPTGPGNAVATSTVLAPVTAGSPYTATGWVYSPNGWDDVEVGINWHDGAGTFLSFVDSAATVVSAGVWRFVSVTGIAPAGAAQAAIRVVEAGAPTPADVLFFDEAVLYAGSGDVPAGATRVVERSTDQVNWQTVRGGTEADVDPAAPLLDDYEFSTVGTNYYRIRILFDAALFSTLLDQVVAPVTAVWVKFPTQPFLNRTVTIVDFGDVTNEARGGASAVVGRSLLVAVTDVRGSDKYELQLFMDTVAAADEMKLCLSGGQVILLQAPGDSPVTPGYYWVGNTTRARPGRLSQRRVLTLPLTQVAPPDASLPGPSITWRGLANRYATWADVIAANATWADVMALRGTVQDVVVP